MAVPQMAPVNLPQQPLMVNSPANALLRQVPLWLKCNKNTGMITHLCVHFHRALQVVRCNSSRLLSQTCSHDWEWELRKMHFRLPQFNAGVGHTEFFPLINPQRQITKDLDTDATTEVGSVIRKKRKELWEVRSHLTHWRHRHHVSALCFLRFPLPLKHWLQEMAAIKVMKCNQLLWAK